MRTVSYAYVDDVESQIKFTFDGFAIFSNDGIHYIVVRFTLRHSSKNLPAQVRVFSCGKHENKTQIWFTFWFSFEYRVKKAWNWEVQFLFSRTWEKKFKTGDYSAINLGTIHIYYHRGDLVAHMAPKKATKGRIRYLKNHQNEEKTKPSGRDK